jgi:hypothetical protein
MRRIGVLVDTDENDPGGKAQLSGFTQGLEELGWTDGRNLRIDVRWGTANVDRMRMFAKELVDLQPDVILSQGTVVTAALQRETRSIPIVFVVVADPVGAGFVVGLPRPAGNITGFIRALWPASTSSERNNKILSNSALDRDRDTVEACRVVLGMRCRPGYKNVYLVERFDEGSKSRSNRPRGRRRAFIVQSRLFPTTPSFASRPHSAWLSSGDHQRFDQKR